MKPTKWPGNWKVACQSCGFWFPSGEIRRRWDGLLVCDKDYETRHPQTLIQIRAETAVPAFVSKDANPDEYVEVCYIEDSSCYADMCTADCARADNTQFTYAFLLDYMENGH
jgi:hypothetical protein